MEIFKLNCEKGKERQTHKSDTPADAQNSGYKYSSGIFLPEGHESHFTTLRHFMLFRFLFLYQSYWHDIELASYLCNVREIHQLVWQN